jgi:hypothetical protein
MAVLESRWPPGPGQPLAGSATSLTPRAPPPPTALSAPEPARGARWGRHGPSPPRGVARRWKVAQQPRQRGDERPQGDLRGLQHAPAGGPQDRPSSSRRRCGSRPTGDDAKRLGKRPGHEGQVGPKRRVDDVAQRSGHGDPVALEHVVELLGEAGEGVRQSLARYAKHLDKPPLLLVVAALPGERQTPHPALADLKRGVHEGGVTHLSSSGSVAR